MVEISGERIFVTGGLGFIGATLCTELVERNQIAVYDNFSRNALQYTPVEHHANLTVVEGSVLNSNRLCACMDEFEPSIVIHLAAVTGVSNYTAMPIRTIKTNMEGTARTLECAARHTLKKFVNFSTSEVYGPNALNAREDDVTSQGPPGALRWTYATSKITAEHLCMAFHQRKGLPVVSVRPFNVYGPLQVGNGAVKSFITAALEYRELCVNGDGGQVRAWCYVSDLIDGVLRAIRSEAAGGQVFNIGNPTAKLTILELAKKVLELTGSDSRLVFSPEAPVEIPLRTPCIDKAARLLDFQPKVSLDEGLRGTIQWYRQFLRREKP